MHAPDAPPRSRIQSRRARAGRHTAAKLKVTHRKTGRAKPTALVKLREGRAEVGQPLRGSTRARVDRARRPAPRVRPVDDQLAAGTARAPLSALRSVGGALLRKLLHMEALRATLPMPRPHPTRRSRGACPCARPVAAARAPCSAVACSAASHEHGASAERQPGASRRDLLAAGAALLALAPPLARADDDAVVQVRAPLVWRVRPPRAISMSARLHCALVCHTGH